MALQVLNAPTIPQIIPNTDGTYSSPPATPPASPHVGSLSGTTYPTLLYLPALDDVSSLSTSDLISLISENVSRVRAMLTKTQAASLDAKQKEIEATAKEALQKLNDSIKKQQEAAEAARKMKIVNWFLMALTIVVTIIVSIVTFGVGSAVAGVIGAAVSVALLVASLVPIKDGKSMIEHATEQTGKAIGNLVKKAYEQYLKDNNTSDTSAVGEDGKTKKQKEIEEGSEYAAMAFVTALQVALAIVMAVASGGGSAGSSVANITKGLSKAGLQTAADAIAKNSAKIIQISLALSKTVQGVNAVAKMGASAGSIHAATLQYEAVLADADTKELDALVKFLQALLEQNEKLLEELIAAAAMDATTIKSLMETAHKNNTNIQKIFLV